MTAQSAGLVLPELPEPVDQYARTAWGPAPDYYTADQMREYGRQCALAAPAADGVDDVLHKLDEWCRAYPESVFPEPTKEDFDAVNSVFPNAVTRISASMGRHMVKHMREMADAIRTAAPQAQGEE